LVTIPIANRAVSAESIGLGVFTKSAKSFDLAFREIKDKNKIQKLWLRALGKVKCVSAALLAIAAPLTVTCPKKRAASGLPFFAAYPIV
jgi:hypothetical protein